MQAGAEQVVAGPEAAEEVDGRRVGRDVDQAALGIGRHRRPRRDVAGAPPRVVLPRLVAELARPRDDVELPQRLAGARVVAEDVAGDVLDARLVVALLVDVADDDHAVDDDRRRRRGQVAEIARDAVVGVVLVFGLQPRLPVLHQVGQHVDDAAGRETRQRHPRAPVLEVLARLGVDGVQEERRRGVEDHLAAADLGEGHALAVVVAHAAFPARGVRLAVGPDRLAGAGIDRRHRAPLPGHGVEQAVDVERRGAEQRIGRRAEVVAAPGPGHFQRLEVGGGDLVERRVARLPDVAADVVPLAHRRAGVLGAHGLGRDDQRQRRSEDDRAPHGVTSP